MLHSLKLRLHALIHRRQFNRDVEDELAFHLAMLEGSDGATAANQSIGNPTRTAENLREMRGWGVAERLWQDLRFAGRLLHNNRGFAAAALVPLALAIGCVATVTTLADAVLYRSTGVNDPRHVGAIYTLSRSQGRYLGGGVSYPDFRDIAGLRDFVDSAAAYIRTSSIVRFQQGAGQMNTELVTGEYFRAAGITPVIGRPLTPRDDQPGAESVALASYALWESRFHRSPSILGSRVWLNDVAFTIVGVMPKGYQGMLLDWYGNPSFYAPRVSLRRFFPSMPDYDNARDVQMGMILVRLRSGVSIPRFQAALDVLSANVEKPDYRLTALPALQARFWPAYRPATVRFLGMLMAVSTAVFAIACFNFAGLLLARNTARQTEIVTRLAVGAARVRVLQQLATENLVLALCAAALTIPVALGITYWFRGRNISSGFGLSLNLSLDARALAIGAGFGLLAAMLAALVPAWRASRGDFVRRSRPSRVSLRDLFVAAQAACAMTVVVGAALLGRSLHGLDRMPLGFDPRGIVLVQVEGLQRSEGPMDRVAHSVLDELRLRTPGAALARESFPSTLRMNIEVSGDGGTEWKPANFSSVSDGYFELLHVPVLAGRSFLPSDSRNAAPVAMLNRTTAQLLWPNQNPVGRRVRWKQEKFDREVVGIVEDMHYRPLVSQEPPPPYLFIPLWQNSAIAFTIHVRTPGPGLAFAEPLRAMVAQVAPDLPVWDIHTLQQQVDDGLSQIRLAMEATGAVSSLAVLLAAGGIFGAEAYRVAQRKREIAIRISIGAQPQRVIHSFAAHGVAIGGVGAAVGLFPATLGERLLRASVPGAGPAGALLFASAAVALTCAAGISAWAAARRIARFEPSEVLRVQ